MSSIEALVSAIRKQHYAYPPACTASVQYLAELGMPEDVLQFYSLADGACLNEGSEYDWNIEIDGRRWKWIVLPTEQIRPITRIGFDLINSPLSAQQEFWLPIVDVMDSNYLSINVASGREGEIIDCFHENLECPGYNSIVALNFTSLLELLISSTECFWLEEKNRVYGAY